MRVSGTPYSRVEQLHAIDAGIRENPADPALRLARARCLDDLGHVKEAMLAYRAVIAAEPAHFEALTNLGSLFIEQGMLDGAATCFYAALHSGWDDPLAHLNVAGLNAQAAAYDTARLHYERVLALFPGDAQARTHAHHGLSRIYEHQDDALRAAEHRTAAFAQPVMWTLPATATQHPLRVLVLKSPRGGDIISNPFFDESTMERVVIVPESFADAAALPPHHVVFNGIADPDTGRATLQCAAVLLAGSRAPVINDPRAVLLTDRALMMQRLAGIAGLAVPQTQRFRRADLSPERLSAAGFEFPLLVRSPGYHAGEHFERIERAEDLAATLALLPGDEFYAIAFADLRGDDGLTRKFRVAFVDRRPYPIHCALGRAWKVHYFSAAMAESALYRAEERRFLDDMDGVLGRAGMTALAAIGATLDLDYAGVDFSRDRNGRIFVFEANAGMAIYPPPEEPQWAYRRGAHAAAIAAVRAMLVERAARSGYAAVSG